METRTQRERNIRPSRNEEAKEPKTEEKRFIVKTSVTPFLSLIHVCVVHSVIYFHMATRCSTRREHTQGKDRHKQMDSE